MPSAIGIESRSTVRSIKLHTQLTWHGPVNQTQQ